jgi:hypothetical protein
MIKKQYFIFVALAVFILISSGMVSANLLKKQTSTNLTKAANREIYLGSATIYGDGTEENTTVDLNAENDVTIGIDSQTETVDFYITYSMNCSGVTDNGALTLLIQITGVQKGINETITFSEKEGKLIVEDIEVNRRDVLTFEIGGVYTNLNPPFVVSDIAIGGGIINKALMFQNIFKHFVLRFFYSQIIVPLFDI